MKKFKKNDFLILFLINIFSIFTYCFVAFLNQNFILILKTTRPRDCFASLMIPLFAKNSRLGYFLVAKSPQGEGDDSVSVETIIKKSTRLLFYNKFSIFLTQGFVAFLNQNEILISKTTCDCYALNLLIKFAKANLA